MPLHACLFVISRIIALYQVGHRTHVGILRELLADEIVLSRHTVARVLKVFNFESNKPVKAFKAYISYKFSKMYALY